MVNALLFSTLGSWHPNSSNEGTKGSGPVAASPPEVQILFFRVWMHALHS